jgi:predicted ribosomally synthesized peptide with nif11-like leader
MAKTDVKKFIDKVQENAELQAKLEQAGKAYQGDRGDLKTVVAQNILPIAREEGFSFTAEEYLECLTAKRGKQELSLDDLDEVTGGVGNVGIGDSNVGGDITIIDNSVNYYFIFAGADMDTVNAILSK